MSEIKIKQITEPICQLYNPKDQFVGTIESHLQLDDVRLQIIERRAEGYYILYQLGNGEVDKIDIHSNGKLSHWPEGFYDQIQRNKVKLAVMNGRRKE